MRYIISFLLTSLASALTAALATTTASAAPPQVVTDIPPVHALVAQVMGDLGQPQLLLTKGASEHDFQLRPSQAQALQDAGLVVWIGPELTPWLARALDGLGAKTQLALLDAPETAIRAFSPDGAHMEDGHDDHDDHEGTDPHAWLDPDNARLWLGLIAGKLAELDPDNAATYAANAEAAQARIAALDGRLKAQLVPYADRPIVAYHDAYGYFAAHYGLHILGSIALGDATAPGAAKLAALQQSLGADKAACLFPEAQHDAALVDRLAEGASLRVGAPLDPVGSTLPPGPDAYDALLGGLADTITACLSQG